jgi:hypothetical protein
MPSRSKLAQRLVARARGREQERQARDDQQAFAQMLARQGQALADAISQHDDDQVVIVIHNAVREWDTVGRWPSDWPKWEKALNRAVPGAAINLRDL